MVEKTQPDYLLQKLHYKEITPVGVVISDIVFRFHGDFFFGKHHKVVTAGVDLLQEYRSDIETKALGQVLQVAFSATPQLFLNFVLIFLFLFSILSLHTSWQCQPERKQSLKFLPFHSFVVSRRFPLTAGCLLNNHQTANAMTC